MRSSQMSMKRTLLLSTFAALSLFSTAAFAQGQNPPGTTRGAPNTSPQPTQSEEPDETPSEAPSNTAPPVITPTGEPNRGPQTGNFPTITGGVGAAPIPTTLPTLSRTADLSIPTYPPPAVPPTRHAPFMQHSSAPEGTVFIAVGAILGAFGAAVLVWRTVVACLLHRSVDRAAMAQHHANDKTVFPPPPAPFYKYTDRDSSPHLAGPVGRGTRRTHRGPTPSATPSQSNLFFSPTAASGSALGGAAGSDRNSRFLPSGFYAAGAGSPANGHGHSISLTNLRPDSQGRGRGSALGPSPPDSPSFGPRSSTTPVPRNISTSSVNLNRPPSGRAPSAFLDDLLDDNPHMFPGQPPSHHHTHSTGSYGRRH